MWDDFNGSQDRTLWFYESVFNALEPNLDNPIVDEFRLALQESRQLFNSPGNNLTLR